MPELCAFQIFFRDTHAHLADVAQRQFLILLDLSDGALQPEITVEFHTVPQQYQPQGGLLHQTDAVQLRAAGVLQLSQTVVDLAFHDLKLLLFAGDQLFLAAQGLRDVVHIPVVQGGRDLIQRQAQRPQVADVGQLLELPDAVVAVAGGRVGVFRLQQAHLLVVAQSAHTQMVHLCHLADLEQLTLSHGAPRLSCSAAA